MNKDMELKNKLNKVHTTLSTGEPLDKKVLVEVISEVYDLPEKDVFKNRHKLTEASLLYMGYMMIGIGKNLIKSHDDVKGDPLKNKHYMNISNSMVLLSMGKGHVGKEVEMNVKKAATTLVKLWGKITSKESLHDIDRSWKTNNSMGKVVYHALFTFWQDMCTKTLMSHLTGNMKHVHSVNNNLHSSIKLSDVDELLEAVEKELDSKQQKTESILLMGGSILLVIMTFVFVVRFFVSTYFVILKRIKAELALYSLYMKLNARDVQDSKVSKTQLSYAKRLDDIVVSIDNTISKSDEEVASNEKNINKRLSKEMSGVSGSPNKVIQHNTTGSGYSGMDIM